MEMKLFKKDNELWTRFKISNKYLDSISAIAIKLYAKKPTKVSSRYTYYEIKGDFINGKF
ncbi:hypothetical protein N496_18485 (plasmid) [Clostridium botulinum A2B3 87]|uniref:hypothetical protein n=1 Tax=Clostridium botulinum TaxID=1491 RepID=UPI0004A5976D|nr:hypothetical protein [Clostridium botulinum]KEI94960.1 hypothetical protein N496_18485 [Clostridium botulinum A2B3 87]